MSNRGMPAVPPCPPGMYQFLQSIQQSITTLQTSVASSQTATTTTSLSASDISGLGYFATGTDAANLTGTVSVNRFNSGTGASSTTFLRGDGTWTSPTASAAWGSITGTLSSQTDLQTALDGKLTVIDGTGDWAGFKQHTNDTGLTVVSATGAGAALTTFGSVGGFYGQNSGATQWCIFAGDLNANSRFPVDGSNAYEFTTAPYVGTNVVYHAGNLNLTGDVTSTALATTIANGAVTLAKMANVATGTVFYRKTAGTGAPEVQTLATLKTDLGLTGTNSGDQTITLTGPVTGSGTGSFATTITAGAVTLAMQANVATGTVFYRKTAGSGAPEVQTLATLKTDLGLTGTNSGDQTITLTGDVTGSGTGSFATTIGANKVTRSMLAATAGAAVLGTTGAGNVTDLTTLPAAVMPAHTGDATSSAGSVALTLATTGVSAASYGSAIAIPVITFDAKGRATAASTAVNTGGWTETTLTADSATTSASFATITDGTRSFTFTPTASVPYECQAVLLLQTATATILPEIQVAVSAQGVGSYGAVQIDQTGATVTTRVTQDGTWTTAAVNVAVPAGGFAAANTPYLCYVTIRGFSGSTPAAIAIQLASETAGTSVRVLKGSQMRVKST